MQHQTQQSRKVSPYYCEQPTNCRDEKSFRGAIIRKVRDVKKQAGKIGPLLLVLAIALPLQARKMAVTAYHSHKMTATGTFPHRGTCAAHRRLLGHVVYVPGMGRFVVTDVCPGGHIDL